MYSPSTSLLILTVIAFIALAIYLLITTEQRVEKTLYKSATKYNVKISTVRDVESSDGKSPFRNFDVWIGTSSNILGISGEQVYNKIVSATSNEVYWIKIKTTLFIPNSVRWKCKKDNEWTDLLPF